MLADALTERRGWALAPVVDWLLADGRFFDDPNAFTAALATRLVDAGAPVVRLRLAMRTLHPLETGWSAIWEAGKLEADRVSTHGLERKASYVGSPLEILRQTGATFRRRLDDLGDGDHRLLHDLKAQGASDYLAVPMLFSTGQNAAMIIVTDRAAGFNDTEVAQFEALGAVLSPLLEVIGAHRLVRTLAAVYIGPRSGARVLEGRIQRGDVETLRAAIWFSDLRGWSRISNALPAADAVALANDYFALVDAAVTDAGGEVLKLIGDAVLAIFPADDEGTDAACAAVAAAQAAQRQADPDRFRFGIGLHLGDLVYGNVGSPTRLDFTVMGQAVNLASRLEGLTRSLDRPIVLSQALAAASGLACEDLGRHAISGWDDSVPVFAPAT